MKNCVQCGAALDDKAANCPVCGAPQPAANVRYEDSVLSETGRFLRYEKLAWKIKGIVLLAISVLIFSLGAFMFVFGLAYGIQPTYEYQPMAVIFVFIIMGMVYMELAATYIVLAIVNLVMVNKVSFYQDALHTDVSVVRKRCGSVGMIVLGGIFNSIAMAFIIVNFVRTKTNAAAFDRLETKKQI